PNTPLSLHDALPISTPTVTASRCCTSCRERCGRRTSTRRRTTPSSSPRRGTRRSSTGRTTRCSRGRRDLDLDPLGGAALGPALGAVRLHLDRQALPQVGERPREIRLSRHAPVQPDLRPLRDLRAPPSRPPGAPPRPIPRLATCSLPASRGLPPS